MNNRDIGQIEIRTSFLALFAACVSGFSFRLVVLSCIRNPSSPAFRLDVVAPFIVVILVVRPDVDQRLWWFW